MADNVIDFGNFPKIKPKIIGIIVVVLLVIIAAFSSFYMVDQKEQAVVLLFGKFNRISEPGLHFKLPFGIEKNYNVPTQRILKEEFGFRTEEPGITTRYSTMDFSEESIMLTGDLNIVDVHWIIQFQIIEPMNWLFKVENQTKTIRDISQSVISLLVGDRTIFDVIGSERANIEQKGQEMMNNYFKLYELGIRVTTVRLQDIVPPKGAVHDAFEDVNKSIQDLNRLINEGKEAYNNAIPRARGQAKQVIQAAEGYAAERVNIAKGDVARFLAVYNEYRKNPNITRTRLYYEIFEELFKDVESVDLIDKKLRNFIPFKSLTQDDRGGEK